MSSATALYRFYDEDDRLLYVGITDDIDTRWTSHATKKHWWPNVARKAVEWFDLRTEAAKAERDAILNEGPLYNVVHTPEDPRRGRRMKVVVQRPHGPAVAAPWHAKVMEELGRQGKTKTWLAKTAQVSRAGIDNWKTQPRKPYAAGVVAVADALGIDRDEALRLAGLAYGTSAPIHAPAITEASDEELLAELHRRLKSR